MRKYLLLVLATGLLCACQTDNYHYEFPEDEIYFPEEGIYGTNILNETTTKFKPWNDSTPDRWYTFKATVPINTSLKITVEGKSDIEGDDFVYSSYTDWILFNESVEADENTRVFIAYGQQVAVGKFGVGRLNQKGSATIKFYKNEERSPFRTKKITWEP